MSLSKTYDVLIVGAGPAGLFAAYELIKKRPHLKIAIIEQGNSIETRLRNEAMSGVGGGGTFSDGKLHFTPVLSHEKLLDLYTVPEYQKYLDYSEKLFTKFGVNAPETPTNMAEAQKLVDECAKKQVKLYIRRCKHVGSDQLPKVVKNIVDFLESRGVKFICNTKVEEIQSQKNNITALKTSTGQIFTAKYYLIAPGRIGAAWLQQQAKSLNITYTPEKIEVGVRVEFPASVMARHSKILHENVYSIITPTFGDIIRTFCPCPNGHVAVETYSDYVCVNGYSNLNPDSDNSNFNFTVPVVLTEPTENTLEYAVLVAKLATLLGGGKPLLQRLVDLRTGHRSTWEKLKNNPCPPSLLDVSPGDISLAFPHRIVTNIIEGLDILNRVLPGINADSTLLYAPEVKLRGNRIKTNKDLQTAIPNLFVAGDGAGAAGNIVGAAISGLMAARGIVKNF